MNVKQGQSDNHSKHVNTREEVVNIVLDYQLVVRHFLFMWLEIKISVIRDLEHYVEEKESIVPEELALALFLQSELKLNYFPFFVVLFVGTRCNNLSKFVSFLDTFDQLRLGEAEKLGGNNAKLQ